MHIKFDRVSDGCMDNKGSCQSFIEYMSKEDRKDQGHNVEWWFDQDGNVQAAGEVLKRIDEDWQGLGKNETKFTTGSINPSLREWEAMGKTDEERLKNFKAWVVDKFTQELAGNFNKHKLPTEEAWLLKGATPEERVEKYKKEVSAEILSKFSKSFYFGKSKEVEEDLKNICTSPDPAERLRAWMYSRFADVATAEAWRHDKKKEEEGEWMAVADGKKGERVKILEYEARVLFRDKFEAKFGEYKSTLDAATKDVDLLKDWLKSTFAPQLRRDFKLPAKKGERIIITPENMKIYFKLEHNRYYKGTDEDVQKGKAKIGDVKPNSNRHIHFIIATKTADKQNRINPQTKNREEFNRTDFFQKVEKSFDKRFDFKRKYEESFAAKLAAAVPKNKVDALKLGKEAFEDRRAEDEAEREEFTKSKGKSL